MKRALVLLLLALPASFAAACGGDDDAASSGDDDDAPDGSVGGASSGGGTGASSSGGASSSSGAPATSCHATPQPDDALRFMVASRPYGQLNDAGSADMVHRFSSWSLSSTGVVSPIEDFELGGYNTAGRIAFSPDGRLGAVALESRTQEQRGTVGVFALDDAGHVTVVHANYKGDFFSDKTAFSPDGAWLYISDSGTANNGGGIYAAAVACDGTLGPAKRLTSGAGYTAPSWAPSVGAAPWRALVAADQLESAADQGLHLYDFDGDTATRVSGTDAFGEQTLVQEIAWAADGTHALLTAPNPDLGGPRLIGVEVDGDAPALDQAFDFPGSETVLASPYGNSFFVGTADPDGVYQVQYTPGAEHAFGAAVEIATNVKKPELPFAGHVITRGALKGRIVLGENTAIRQLQFQPDGSVTDVSKYATPSTGDSDLTSIVGGFGVTP